MLFHWQLINPFWPDAQPWDTWILVVVAIVVVWWNRDTMFSRDGRRDRGHPGRRVAPRTGGVSDMRVHSSLSVMLALAGVGAPVLAQDAPELTMPAGG